MLTNHLDIPIDRSKVDFRYFITLALRKELYWKTLKCILEDLTKDFTKSKQLNGILLEEIEKLQEKLLTVLNCGIDVPKISSNTFGNDEENRDILDEKAKSNQYNVFQENQPIDSSFVEDKTENETELKDSNLSETDKFEYENVDTESEEKESLNKNINQEIHSEISSPFETVGKLHLIEERDYEIDFEDNFPRETDEKDNIKSELECPTCFKKFASEFSMQRHQILIHKSELVRFKKKKTSFRHKKPSKLKTGGINEENENKLEIKSGEKASLPDKYQCSYCRSSFTRRTKLRLHKERHVNMQLNCQICGEGFQTMRQVRNHSFTHKGPKPFMCEICGKYFKKEKMLKDHTSRHHKEKTNECPTCFKKYSKLSELKNHQITHSSTPRPKIHQCITCSKKFSSLATLTLHEKTHSGVKRFTCQFCGKKFHEKSDLEDHKETHIGESHTCTYCEKSFAKKIVLYAHLKSHLGEKKFQCPECDKSFLRNWMLNRHITIHKTEQPHVESETDK